MRIDRHRARPGPPGGGSAASIAGTTASTCFAVASSGSAATAPSRPDRRKRAHRPHQGRRRPPSLLPRRQRLLEWQRAASMSDPIGELLRARSVIVLDGALATELERRGADLADPLWSARCLLEQPELIRQVHLDYFRAGAQVATTATYQATFEGFARRGIDPRPRRSSDARGRVARSRGTRGVLREPALRARSRACWSPPRWGPTARCARTARSTAERYGLSDRELAEFHRPRLEVLAGSGADVLAFETLPCLQEALVLAELLDGVPRHHRVALFFLPRWRCTTAKARTSGAARRRFPSVAELPPSA